MDNGIDCPFCNGQGFLLIGKSYGHQPCEKCYGTGTLTWLERIFGKNGNVDELIRKLAYKIRNRIDEDILKELYKCSKNEYVNKNVTSYLSWSDYGNSES